MSELDANIIKIQEQSLDLLYKEQEQSLERWQEKLPGRNNNVDVYFVRHAESCSNITKSYNGLITHPPLSYKGIQQAINLGINNKIIDMDFDKYYCSPSLRTIMTACLALRQKCRDRNSDNPIKLHLCPYLIEHKNLAGSSDQQNSIVPKQQLNNMINYIKLWFEQKYFDNYIDYEFVHIMFNLVLLLKYNDKLNDRYIIPIKKLLQLEESTKTKEKINRTELLNGLIIMIKAENDIEPINEQGIINKENNDISNIYKNILLLLDDQDSEDLQIYQIPNSNNKLNYKIISEQLKSLINSKYFMNNIIIKPEYGDNEIPTYKGNIENFIINEIVPIIKDGTKQNNKILCFSHGSILKYYFKLDEDKKLKNTEILIYNPNNETKKIIRKLNNNIIIDEQLVKDTCGDLKDIINMRSMNKYKMFQVINNYFNNPNYRINTDTIIENDFKVVNDKEIEEEWEQVDLEAGRYKHKYHPIYQLIKLDDINDRIYKDKYLKYKHKYLNYKKLKFN